jgi:hypothetical protein
MVRAFELWAPPEPCCPPPIPVHIELTLSPGLIRRHWLTLDPADLSYCTVAVFHHQAGEVVYFCMKVQGARHDRSEAPRTEFALADAWHSTGRIIFRNNSWSGRILSTVER